MFVDRWRNNNIGLDQFEKLFVSIANTLEDTSLNVNKECNMDTSIKASSFLKLVTTFEFIVSLVITRTVFDMTLEVTKMLQSRDTDILDAVHMIETIKKTFFIRQIRERLLPWRVVQNNVSFGRKS